jgi:hypothetical protein
VHRVERLHVQTIGRRSRHQVAERRDSWIAYLTSSGLEGWGDRNREGYVKMADKGAAGTVENGKNE